MPSEERWKEIMEDREKTVLQLLEEAVEILEKYSDANGLPDHGPIHQALTKVDFAIITIEDAEDQSTVMEGTETGATSE
jgi:hypothetical protein